MYVVGIDENGFGPQMGMLTVTGSLFEVKGYNREDFWNGIKGRAGVGDSKRILKFNQMAEGERTVLTYYNLFNGRLPEKFKELLDSVSLSSLQELRQYCSSPAARVCWEPEILLPHWIKIREDEICRDAAKIKKRMRHQEIRLIEVKTAILCPYKFNALIEKGTKKTHLDFTLFERLIEYFYKQYGNGRKYLFLCGKIGGTRRYLPWFNYLQDFKVLEKKEGIDSVYSLEGIGRICFLKDGDEKHFPIALSSIFGKYIREVFIERMNCFFTSRIKNLQPASGYHDRITEEYKKKTANLRDTLNIPDKCFLRIR
ncbi:MAG: hypothetical protein U9O41_09025 [Candidatus Aerophobetes bacterium]|nr:hypothetical protein [Candidatus Aerophobetes bacterium]